ncbi:hypothetical protein HNQ50_003200 [Silvimonas terrae]|uniref:Flippase-like domain-containing protein n=1 Tax=Silvimonas terrae TaxID=300266 RepID=A0A840RFW0_9NEIS|nr:lysylphosphatidylglycerol synthase domain-containing protein [Silvimonas terrae]MBB5192459.1 hypothetical protein [Silvimonas terrae]
MAWNELSRSGAKMDMSGSGYKARRVLDGCALAFWILAISLLVRLGFLWRGQGDLGAGVSSLLAAGGLYLIGHGFRAARLMLLIGDYRVGIKKIALVHFFTAGVSVLLPFKLGEIYRVAELSNLLNDMQKAVLGVWIERAYDIAILCVLLGVVAFGGGPWSNSLGLLLVISTIFVVGTVVVFGILPYNVNELALYMVRRYRSPGSVRVLQGISLFKEFTDAASRMLSRKKTILLLITALIWACETFAIVIVFHHADWNVAAAVAQMLGSISDAASSINMLHVTQTLTALSTLEREYFLVLLSSLLLAAVIAGAKYIPPRIHSTLNGPKTALSGKPNR